MSELGDALKAANPYVAIGSAILGGVGAARKSRAMKLAKVWEGRIQRLKNRQALSAFARDFATAQQTNLAAGVGMGADITSSAVQGQIASTTSSFRRGITDTQEIDYMSGKMNRQLRKAGRGEQLVATAGAVGAGFDALTYIGNR